MVARCSAEQDADHRHDLMKHEPRVINALEIALAIKGLKNIHQAAALIQQYANTVAAGAKLEGVNAAYDRMNTMFDEVIR